METGFSPLQQRDTRHSCQRSRFPGGAATTFTIPRESARSGQSSLRGRTETGAEHGNLLLTPAATLQRRFNANKRKAAPLAALTCQGTASFF